MGALVLWLPTVYSVGTDQRMEEREARPYHQLPLCHGARGWLFLCPQEASPLGWPTPESVLLLILLLTPAPYSWTMLAASLLGQPGNTVPTLLFSLKPSHDFLNGLLSKPLA